MKTLIVMIILLWCNITHASWFITNMEGVTYFVDGENAGINARFSIGSTDTCFIKDDVVFIPQRKGAVERIKRLIIMIDKIKEELERRKRQ